jgi:hypothetical protein
MWRPSVIPDEISARFADSPIGLGDPMFNRFRAATGLVTVALCATVAVGAYAFTASNTVPAHSAGSGAAAISGYTVPNPAYTFSADGTKVTAVGFNLDKGASDVQVALTATPVHADWQDCSASGATTPFAVTCSFATPVAVGSATNLSVVAVSTGVATIAP